MSTPQSEVNQELFRRVNALEQVYNETNGYLKGIVESNEKLIKLFSKALYILVANPVDILTYAFLKYTGLPKNQVFGPLASEYGFTIVRVLETRRATPPSLNSPGIKARVEDSVRRKKSEERYREWIERLRSKAVIRTYI